MVVGNAVVWWRVFTVYPYNKAVKAVGVILVLSTLGKYDNLTFTVAHSDHLTTS